MLLNALNSTCDKDLIVTFSPTVIMYIEVVIVRNSHYQPESPINAGYIRVPRGH